MTKDSGLLRKLQENLEFATDKEDDWLLELALHTTNKDKERAQFARSRAEYWQQRADAVRKMIQIAEGRG